MATVQCEWMALTMPENSPEYTGDTPDRGAPSGRMEVETMRRPHICLWKDLSRSDVETLEGAESAEDVRRALHPLLSPEESVSPLRASALLDLYYYTVRFSQDRGLSAEQTSCLLSIIRETHASCAETSLGNVDECYQYFRELLMCHAVHRPPLSVAVFTQQQLPHISDYVLRTYFRHFKLYKYVFTPQVGLDLTIFYDDDDEEAESAGQEMEKNDLTEDDMSAPGAETRKTERQDQTVGSPPGDHMDQHSSQEVREMSNEELQDNLQRRTETKSPGGGAKGREETRTRSPGGGAEGREETRTRSQGGGAKGREETRTRSPGGGTEGRKGSAKRILK